MLLSDYRDYFNDWMYLERYVNSGSDHKYSHQTQVPAQFRPQADSEYFFLWSMGISNPENEHKFPRNFYPVHPFTAKLYEQLGHKLTRTNIKIVPTSSTRTLLADDDGTRFFIKLDLPVIISRFNRAINLSDVTFSSEINSAIRDLRINSNNQFGIFQEIGGGHTFLNNSRDAGYIMRETTPTWVTSENQSKFYMIPSFSLTSLDPSRKSEEPLLIQVLRKNGRPKEDLFEKIIYPLFEFWFALAEHGLLWEMQQQNTLFVMNEKQEIIGIAIRDFDGVYIDEIQRNSKNLTTSFCKHKLSTKTELEKRYSMIFDHRLCKQQVLRIIETYAKYYADKQEIIDQTIAYVRSTMPKSVKGNLPAQSWYTVPEVLFTQGIVLDKKQDPPLR